MILKTSTELFLAKAALDLVAVSSFMTQNKDKGPLLTQEAKDLLCQEYHYTKTALTEMKVNNAHTSGHTNEIILSSLKNDTPYRIN